MSTLPSLTLGNYSKAIVRQHRDVFAVDMTELGKCNIPDKSIDTFDLPAIRQQFYHQPPQLQRKIDRQVEELLHNDVI